MSTSSEPSPINGQDSPSGDENISYFANGNQSESDLSYVQNGAADAASPDFAESSDAVGSPTERPELTLQEPSDPSDDGASDDGDFDAAGSPASVQSQAQSNDYDDRAGSVVSDRPAPKRKVGQVIEDEYMRENPELYGLRRSVRLTPLSFWLEFPLTIMKQTVASSTA